jgi:RNA polymerase sigma factor (sigma-70 family)
MKEQDSETLLLKQAGLRKDNETFLSVIASNKGIIYKVANSYCKNEENKKDLIQEILIQLWLSFSRYDGKHKLSTWMYTIALNVSISFYRKEYRRHEINHALPDTILYLNEESSAQLRNTELDQLQQFIKELKEIDRAIIILYLEENSQQEIGEILGLTVTNVSTRVARIKQQLKQKFSNVQS